MNDQRLHPTWPVLRDYAGEHLSCIAMPLGGIGTGTVSLGGRGDLRDWEIMNRPAKGHRGGEAFFALWAQPEGRALVTRVLEGVLEPPYEGSHGIHGAHHGLPRFRHCRFSVAYPLAQVQLSDPAVPLTVRLEAWNPLVPADADASGLPIAVLRYVLHNPGDVPVKAVVCGSLRNTLGSDGTNGEVAVGRNDYVEATGLRGLMLRAPGLDQASPQYGTMALVTTAHQGTHQCAWPDSQRRRWHSDLLAFWDDLSADGKLTPNGPLEERGVAGALTAEEVIPPGEERAIVFILAWHFPNRQTWTPASSSPTTSCACEDACAADTIGNYYTSVYADAWDAAQRAAPQLPTLEERTVQFVRAFCDSDLPLPVKEAALFNLSTLRSPTCFRTPDGRFFGWEGCSDAEGCCYGSCTHVWNYEQATALLFGDLARSMRDTEFLHATDERGCMSFRVNLPLERAGEYSLAAADGQMGCLAKLYREWQLSGDDDWLRRLWPEARQAMAFCWIPGGWDADEDGVMEGCQHNTLDVEYFGPNPLMAGWYLAALRASEEMARYLGDDDMASRCRSLFERGSRWVDENLFNGEFYVQHVLPPPPDAPIADGLRHHMGAEDLSDPDFQMGPGCLVDQLVGQLVAHVCGLSYLLDPEHVRRALASILRYNMRSDLFDHVNPMRTFALNDEQGLVMCSYPHGERPKRPVPYFAELMTGFEYAAAVHMLYEGMEEEGVRVIDAIRGRYDGRNRNPFDEAECGHHYARAMASWAAVLALTGFHYSVVDGTITFTDRPGQHFWSTGYGWGTCNITAEGGARHVTLSVLGGVLRLHRVRLGDGIEGRLPAPREYASGEVVEMDMEADTGQ